MFSTCIAAALLSAAAPAQADEAAEPARRKYFVSTSLFMLANLFPAPPHFYQLNLGFRPTPQDTLILEAITWTYDAPLGIPWGKAYDDPQHDFPGFVRDRGVGLAYQRFWWKGAYTTVHATPFLQTYHERDGDRIQSGFQLFLTIRAGYHFRFLRERLFFEPSVACTAWPINTNLPPAFAAQEDRWPGYFLLEPGLNVGVNL